MVHRFIDTHTHLYDEQFRDDIDQVISNAIAQGVDTFILPNCDSSTLSAMLDLSHAYPMQCLPMIGLHPVYVKENFRHELDIMEQALLHHNCVAIGEIGLDFYWDKTYIEQQFEAFKIQISWALERHLPISIHTRASIDEGIEVIQSMQNGHLKGVFHCFSGDLEQAKKIVDQGFLLGIGGVATFKNSDLKNFLSEIDLSNIILETDAPYLAPVPYRGKRNESSYIPLIAETLSNIYQCDVDHISKQTTSNALKLFNIS